MAGVIFAVLTRDPVSGEPSGLNVDIDWNIVDAAIVANSVGGEVVAAPRGEWSIVDPVAVAQAFETHRQQLVNDELRAMLAASETDETGAGA